MANEVVGVQIKVDSSQATQSLGSIRKEIKQANSDLIAAQAQFGDYSAEAIAAAKKVAQLKDSIQEARETADLFDPGKKFQVFAGAASAVAGGFSAVQGAIGLVGVKSEEVEKSILKVQSALALSQGLSTIADSVKDFQRLGAVIQSTTVFQKANNAVTVVAATVTRAFGGAVDATSTSFKVLKGAIATTGIGLLVVAIGELVSAFQNYQSEAEKAKEAQDKLNESIKNGADIALKTELDLLASQEKIDIARAKQRGASEKEIFDIEQGFRKSRGEAQIRYWKEIKSIDAKGAIDAENEVKRINNEGVVARINFETEEAKRRKEAQKERDKEKKEIAESQERVDRQLALRENLTSVQVNAITSVGQSAVQRTIAVARTVTNGIQVTTEQQAEAVRKLSAIKRAETESELALAQQTFAALSTLVDQNSVAGKAIAVAQSIINTYQGATKALSQGGIFGQIAAAATIAAGLFQVKKIISTKIPSASGSGTVAGGGSVPSFNAAAPISPQAPIQNTVTQLDQRSVNQLSSATNRAYVVESDVTNSQERVTRINRAARLA